MDRRRVDVEPQPDARLQADDEILLAGPVKAMVAAEPLIGIEIDGEHVMRAVMALAARVLVLHHGAAIAEGAPEAVVRELAEETGLEGVCGPFVGYVELIDGDHHHVVLDFEVTVLEPSPLVAGDDAIEAAWVPIHDVVDWALAPGLAEFLADHDLITTIV